MRQRLDIADLQQEQQTDPKQDYSNEIIWAINENDQDFLTMLFVTEVDADQEITYNDECLTPLMYAAHTGNYSMLEFLCSWDASVNLLNKNNHSALYFAMLNGSSVCVKLLLWKNASITYSQKDASGSYLVECASAISAEIFGVLIEDIVNKQQQKNHDFIKLAELVLNDHDKAIKVLSNLEDDALFNQLLRQTLEHDYAETCKYLLDRIIKLDEVINFNREPYSLICYAALKNAKLCTPVLMDSSKVYKEGTYDFDASKNFERITKKMGAVWVAIKNHNSDLALILIDRLDMAKQRDVLEIAVLQKNTIIISALLKHEKITPSWIRIFVECGENIDPKIMKLILLKDSSDLGWAEGSLIKYAGGHPELEKIIAARVLVCKMRSKHYYSNCNEILADLAKIQDLSPTILYNHIANTLQELNTDSSSYLYKLIPALVCLTAKNNITKEMFGELGAILFGMNGVLENNFALAALALRQASSTADFNRLYVSTLYALNNQSNRDQPGNTVTVDDLIADDKTKPMVLRSHVIARLYFHELTGKSKKLNDNVLRAIFTRHKNLLELLDCVVSNYVSSHVVDSDIKEAAIAEILGDFQRIENVCKVTPASILSISLTSALTTDQASDGVASLIADIFYNQ